MIEKLKIRLIALLRWSEKYTKTDMLYATKGMFWLVVGQGIYVVTGLVLAVAFANLLPKEIYGTYQFIMAGAVVLSAFTLSGMDVAITRSVARGSEGALRNGLHTQLRWSTCIAFASAALATYYYLNENNTLAISFLIVGAFAPFLEGFTLARSYLIGKQLFKESAVMGFGRRLIPVVSLLTAVVLTQNPVILTLVYFASNTLSAGLLYSLIVRRYSLPRTADNEMIGYSKHLSFLRIWSDIITQADKVLVWGMLGAAPLAAYVIAQLPISQMQSGFKLLRSLTVSKSTTVELPVLQKTLPHKVRMLLLATSAGVASYIVCAPFLLTLFFPAYPESILISQVLALSVLSLPRTLYAQALTAHKKKREIYILNMSQNVVKLALLFVLIYFFGLWGAIYATLATQLYATALTHYLFIKAQKDESPKPTETYEEAV